MKPTHPSDTAADLTRHCWRQVADDDPASGAMASRMSNDTDSSRSVDEDPGYPESLTGTGWSALGPAPGKDRWPFPGGGRGNNNGTYEGRPKKPDDAKYPD